jgi:gluconolactonase
MSKSPYFLCAMATLSMAGAACSASSGDGGTGGTVAATGGVGGGLGGFSGSGGSGGIIATGATGGIVTPPTGGGPGTGGAPPTNGPCVTGTVYEAPNLAVAPAVVYTAPGTAGFLEGPVWVAAQGALYFSDLGSPAGISKLVPPNAVTPFLTAGSNGLAVDASGRIVGCTHDTKSISIIDPATAGRVALVSDYQGLQFNSPNDVTVRADYTVYFTDPDWQGTGTVGFTGVYRVPPGAPAVAVLVDGTLTKPNGIALSPDGGVLYVDDYNTGGATGRIGYYVVNADGSVGPRGEFAGGLSAPDGMAVDCAGNLYVAENSTGILHVYAPNAAPLGTITIAPSLTNVAFGGADGKTLYVTAGRSVYAIAMNVPGLPY